MSSVFKDKCTECGGKMETVELENFDRRLVPEHIRDKLEDINVCSSCGFVVFYVDECEQCEEESIHPWKCEGYGEEKKLN